MKPLLRTNEPPGEVNEARSAEMGLAAEPASVAQARRFTHDTLQSWQLEVMSDSVMLAASELVTNAILHSGSPPTIRLVLRPDTLRLEVRDGSERHPRRRRYGSDATTGRGVVLVDSLAHRWGSESNGGGKVVWCEFELPE